MSISSAFSSALSGLTASSRMAEVTASNVANALTEGYGRREVQLASRIIGSTGIGVTINGVSRSVDGILLQDLRLSTSGQGYHQARSGFLNAVDKAIGTPDQTGSISDRISALERSLVEAAARPESEARLAAVADAATGVTRVFSDVSSTIQQERQRADNRIAFEVGQVNEALVGLADINLKIRVFNATGRETAALMDQRQQLVDRIAAVVPVKEIPRANGEIALYTTGGTMLLESKPSRIEFTPTSVITADMTLSGGGLSGLTVNGIALSTGPSGGRLGTGSLAAQFDIRDRLAPDAQNQLDAIARDLVERFASPGLDPTLAPGAPGLFTDLGATFVAADEVGLAGRLRLNAAVDPANGGALWRLREGLGAAVPTSPGAPGQLPLWSAALSDRRAPVSGNFGAGPRSFAALAADLISGISVTRLNADSEAAFSAARSGALRSEMLRDGVDTDAEMQSLLQIENAYSANAKVLKTVDDMLQQLLGI